MMVSTTAGGRPLKSAASRPGATHGGSIDLDEGAILCRVPERGCPSSEECFPGMWTVRSDLNCVWLQRRRWRESCDMRCDRISPSRLMYETAAVLSVRTSTCLPNSSGRNCRKAKCAAHSSRQLMCQSSRGPVQSSEAACPFACSAPARAGCICCDNNMPGHLF